MRHRLADTARPGAVLVRDLGGGDTRAVVDYLRLVSHSAGGGNGLAPRTARAVVISDLLAFLLEKNI